MINRITPDNIQELKDNEVFVFGANLSSIHGGGAAKLAYEKFGAIWGGRMGIQGKSYAIPTKSEGITRTLSIEEIQPYVQQFIQWAKYHTGNVFLVTAIGTGLAGIESDIMAELFRDVINIPNIHLPKQFWNYLLKDVV